MHRQYFQLIVTRLYSTKENGFSQLLEPTYNAAAIIYNTKSIYCQVGVICFNFIGQPKIMHEMKLATQI